MLYIHTDEADSDEQSPAKTMIVPSEASVGVNVVVSVLDEKKGRPAVKVEAELLADEEDTVDDMSSDSRSTESPESAGLKMYAMLLLLVL